MSACVYVYQGAAAEQRVEVLMSASERAATVTALQPCAAPRYHSLVALALSRWWMLPQPQPQPGENDRLAQLLPVAELHEAAAAASASAAASAPLRPGQPRPAQLSEPQRQLLCEALEEARRCCAEARLWTPAVVLEWELRLTREGQQAVDASLQLSTRPLGWLQERLELDVRRRRAESAMADLRQRRAQTTARAEALELLTARLRRRARGAGRAHSTGQTAERCFE